MISGGYDLPSKFIYLRLPQDGNDLADIDRTSQQA